MTPQEALAQALHGQLCDDSYINGPIARELAQEAMTTPEMQAIARQAAIGAAVERLQRYRSSFMFDWHPNAWLVTVRAIPKSKGVASTLPEAIAAALEDDR